MSIGPLGPRFFKVVTTSLHFLSAFHVCIPWPFAWPFAWLVRAQEAPWGCVLPANATPSSLHLRPGSVQDVACISVNRAIHGACGSLECSCFGIEGIPASLPRAADGVLCIHLWFYGGTPLRKVVLVWCEISSVVLSPRSAFVADSRRQLSLAELPQAIKLVSSTNLQQFNNEQEIWAVPGLMRACTFAAPSLFATCRLSLVAFEALLYFEALRVQSSIIYLRLYHYLLDRTGYENRKCIDSL